MRNRIWTTALAGVLVLVLVGGCARKPKLDLTGLRGTGPRGGESVSGGTFAPSGFDPLGFGAAGTGADLGGAGEGGWGRLDQPLGGAGAGGIVRTQERWASVVVYFAYDSAAIGPAELPKLETLAGHLREHGDYAVIIEGHCDERGSDEYNRALGEQRAIVVRDHLMSLGIAGERLETISYGEERPAVPNATSEDQHTRNRRAEFIIGPRS